MPGGSSSRKRRDRRIQPQPDPDRRHRLTLGAESPWTDQELDDLVERAVRFIADAQRRWGARLGLAVGVWLYRELYRMDDAYLRSRDPRKERSLYDIAKRTGYDVRTMRTWVWAGRMKTRLADEGFDSDRLMLTDWAALYQLRDKPLAARQVAEWIRDTDPTVEEVLEHVRGWREHEGKPPRPEPRKRRGKKRARRRPDDLRLVRVMRLVHGWISESRMSEDSRRKLLVTVREIRTILEAGT